MSIPHPEDCLFDIDAPPPVSLADRFGVAPFSILDRRAGEWADRKRRWLAVGIRSELGRADNLLNPTERLDWLAQQMKDTIGLTSVFDPVLCELAYRWFTAPGDRILDPFAGGSVRGIVASILARHYTGVDLRDEQVAANREQAHLGLAEYPPRWHQGDSTQLPAILGPDPEYDLVFSCPPYADLERYSDDPADLSTMGYDEFREAHTSVIREACRYLRRDRFAVWVISDVRDKKGMYRGLVGHTTEAFQAAGLQLYNDAVILDPVGNARLRAAHAFTRTRKVARLHQHFLVYVKGDPRVAARRLGSVEGGGDDAAA